MVPLMVKHAVDLIESKPKVFWCPEADKDLVGWTQPTLSYGINLRLSWDGPNRPTMIHTVSKPTRMGMIGDSAEGKYWGSGIYHSPALPGDRHDGGGNVVFVDGHVEWHTYTNLIARGGPYSP